ncbi:MAG: LysM peptidoglycan-binding domain-containing protein [Candidatus Eisenbacteria bacterium]|nr:LysM peptidoglycan-binding domain-containing protein [Candidatus Eisenbacteria bacterium]
MTDRKTLRRALLAAVLMTGILPASLRAAESSAPLPDTNRPDSASVARSEPVVPLPDVEPSVPGPFQADSELADSVMLDQPAIEDVPLQVNADVLKWIEFFTGAGRSTFERWLKRSGRYMELFRTVLQKEGLPPDLVHLVFVESGFNMNARSYAAAVGPWQFLRSTSRLFGLNVNQWVDERKDPEKATVAAARYLKHLYGIFGDWPLALASYNAGEGTVLRAIKSQGTTNYWDLKLPRQTEQYVPQFMAALAITRNPVKYGFTEVEFDDPMRFDEVAFKGAVDLRSIAKLADCSIEDLKDLNPAARTTRLSGASGVTTLRVPEGRSGLIQKRLAEGAKLPAVSLTVRHSVRRGETLGGIAHDYSVSATKLAAVNGLSRKKPLRRGMMLTIPASAQAPTPSVIDPDDPRASTDYVPSRKIGLPVRLDGNSDASDRVNHIVRKGETLEGIAAQYGVSADDIRTWNNLDSGKLRVRQRLRVHSPEDAALANAAADSASIAALKIKVRKHSGSSRGSHIVRAGETLSSIAKRHGTTVHALKRANGLSSSFVRAGQRLRLPA